MDNEVELKFLTAYINITNEYYKGLGLAKKSFAEAIEYFGKEEIFGIEGLWLRKDNLRDNYDAFIKVYDGSNFEEAAFKTATGNIAKSLDFTKIDIESSKVKDVDGVITEINAFFIK